MFRKVLLGIVLSLSANYSFAQEWPTRQPIKLVIANAAGSGVDVIARVVFDQVSRQVNQAIVAENRPGAAGTIGMAAVAKAEPDGYSILVASSAIAIAPFTHRSLPYDTNRELGALAPIGSLTNVILAPAGRFKNVQALIAAGKLRPDALSYASLGPGSTGHLSAERFSNAAGFKALNVPYKGVTESFSDLAAGRVDFYIAPVASALGMVKEGKLDALAIASSTRSSLLPDLPTTEEMGYPDTHYDFWLGIFVQAQTPKKIVDRLYDETHKALQTPSVKERFKPIGVEPLDLSQVQFGAFFKKEMEGNERLVRAANIIPD